MWHDTDRDGLQYPDEPGIGGVPLTLSGPGGSAITDFADQTVGTWTMAADGSYAFANLAALPRGSYTVGVDRTSTALTCLLPTTASSGLSRSGLAPGESDLGLDLGFAPEPAAPPRSRRRSARRPV